MGDFEYHNTEGADQLFGPRERVHCGAHVKNLDSYSSMYKESINDPSTFWMKVLDDFDFKWRVSPSPEKFLSYNFDVRDGPIKIEWMRDGETNVCFNCLDRHVQAGLGDRVAYFWAGNHPGDVSSITYSELLRKVCRFANVLKIRGVEKGSRVAIYMPMVVELVVAVLACARIGAMHSVVFAGFSAVSLADRTIDAQSTTIITADGAFRGKKLIHLKQICDDAVRICTKRNHSIKDVIVFRHVLPASQDIDATVPGKRPFSLKYEWHEERDRWWHELDADAGVADYCDPVWVEAETPLFLLYTSGSTGVPKGVLHTTAGYMLYAATTFKYSFDFHHPSVAPDDVYWCTADVGWITGHTYVVYGPLLNAATSVMFEGLPTYPDPGRCWQIVDDYKVTQFYTAPTLVRQLMMYGDEHVKKYSRQSLRILGTVGEPINPEAWHWYDRVIGDQRCAVVDTYWQTETGGHVIAPYPGATPCKAGSATFPLFGIEAVILDDCGAEVENETEGHLCIGRPWPGIMRTVFADQKRFEKTYFSKFPGYYVTGDGAKRDKDGYIWVTGRIDDMLNVSGHLLSTAQIESALVSHAKVCEAAVVVKPHDVKGEAAYAFVTLCEGHELDSALAAELRSLVRTMIAPFATPDWIQLAPALPKTRSGKIMRRILRRVAVGDENIGDVTTLADNTVVDDLFRLREHTF